MNEPTIDTYSNGRIARPTDVYSPLWPAYWAQNPHLGRGVGADAADDDAGNDDGGGEDLDAIRRDAAEAKKLREENELWKKKHGESEKHKKDQEKAARDAAAAAAKASGDLEAYEKSVNEKINGITQEIGSERDLFRSIAEKRTSGAAAIALANKLALDVDGVSTADALLPHIKGRVGSKIVDGDMVPVVLDANGRETALTLDDLEKELRKVSYLKSLIRASNANGAGSPGGQGQGGGGTITRAQFAAMSPAEQSKAVAAKMNIVD